MPVARRDATTRGGECAGSTGQGGVQRPATPRARDASDCGFLLRPPLTAGSAAELSLMPLIENPRRVPGGREGASRDSNPQPLVPQTSALPLS